MEQIIRLYNIAYNNGHDDTVEGCSTPAAYSEMSTHQRDVVEDVLMDIIND